MHTEEQRFMSTGQVARTLGVSCESVRRWVSRGLVQALRDARGWRYFRLEDVERLRERREPRAENERGGDEK